MSDTQDSNQETVRQEARIMNPLRGQTLYTDPITSASQQAMSWQNSRPDDAARMTQLAALPAAKWLTSSDDLDDELKAYLQAAQGSSTLPVLVVYNIPDRDCGLYSSGGAADSTAYRQFIDTLATIVGTTKTVLILEPDAVASTVRDGEECLQGDALDQRYQLLRYAAQKLGELPSGSVYMDAGNSAWIRDISRLVDSLEQAGIRDTNGFSLNVSNFQTNKNTIAYGRQISAQLSGMHFVIDTSRNGNGPYKNTKRPDFNWCNPPGRALGHYPTTDTGEPGVDAYLYIKTPGESDGQDPDPAKCQGGPAAGEWWPEYALGLVQRWPKELQPTTE